MTEHIPKVLQSFPIPECEEVCPEKCLGFQDLVDDLRSEAVWWIQHLRKHKSYFTERSMEIKYLPREQLQLELWIKNFFGVQDVEIFPGEKK